MHHTTKQLRRFEIGLHVALFAPLLLGGGLAWRGVFAPIHRHAHDAQTQLERMEELTHTAPALGRECAALRLRLAQLEAHAVAVRQRIPDGPEEAEFLQQVHQAAEESGLTLHDYRRGNAVVGPRHSRLEVHLIGSGDHASICRFFHRVDKFQRQTQTKNIVIRASDDEPTRHVEVSLMLFYRTPGTAESKLAMHEGSSHD